MIETTVNKTAQAYCEDQSRSRRSKPLVSMFCGALTLGMLFGGFAGTASATELAPTGPEFQINALGPGSQKHPDVAIGGNGHAMAVWESPKPGGTRISGLRYGADGFPISGEYELGNQWGKNQSPKVAMDASGNTLVVWVATNADSGRTIVGQRYNHFGVEVGSMFEVTPFPTDPFIDLGAHKPEVSMDANGNALVVWSWGELGWESDEIYGQRYDSTGAPVGSEFLVTSELGYQKGAPVLDMNASGNVMVVWGQYDVIDGGRALYARRFDNTGAPIGNDFKLTENDNGASYAVAMDVAGNAVLIWTSWYWPGYGVPQHQIFGQRYDVAGMPVGPEFLVNAQPSEDFTGSKVDMDDDGNFVVTWKSQDADGGGVFARLYHATGTSAGPEFQVNTFTQHSQHRGAVAMGDDRNVMMVWQSHKQDAPLGYGIFGQRFTVNEIPVCTLAQARPAALFSNDQTLQTIRIDQVSDPDGDPFTVTVDEIYQDEPVSGFGFGFTSPDGQGVGTNAAEVRSEYLAGGNGRQYRIGFTAEDSIGSSCSGSAVVRVIKNKMDWDWIIYDSTVTP